MMTVTTRRNRSAGRWRSSLLLPGVAMLRATWWKREGGTPTWVAWRLKVSVMRMPPNGSGPLSSADGRRGRVKNCRNMPSVGA